MSGTDMVNTLVSGLSIGGTYGFLALAYALIFSTTGVFNLAQAQLLVLGGLLGHSLLVSWKWNWIVAAIFVMGVVVVVGLVQEYLTVKPVKSGYGWILTTLGASFILQSFYGHYYGAEPLPVPGVISSTSMTVAGVRFVPSQVLVIVILLLIVIVIEACARHTRLGKAWRATAQNPETASTLGINTRAVVVMIFALAAAIAALGGLMTAPTMYAAAYGGDLISFMSFLGVAVGGMSTNLGAVLGGLAIGVIEAFSLQIVGAQFNLVVLLAVVLTFLLIRPHGLVSAGREREV